jgi:peroxiredoxin
VRLRYLAWMTAGGAAALMLCLWSTAGTLQGSFAGSQDDAGRTLVPRDERHYVTPNQLETSGEAAGRQVMRGTLLASDGRYVDWDDLSAGRPIVVVFIKDGCPCSIEFEPFFHRVARAFAEHVQFVGVIDGACDVASAYVAANDVPYPVLADPDRALIRDFAAKNAAYVALVSAEGIVDAMWPGCSAEMMQDLCGKMAARVGINEPPIDFLGMPGPLTTGCPFRE